MQPTKNLWIGVLGGDLPRRAQGKYQEGTGFLGRISA